MSSTNVRPEEIEIELIADAARNMRIAAMRDHAAARASVADGKMPLAVAQYEGVVAKLTDAHSVEEALHKLVSRIAAASQAGHPDDGEENGPHREGSQPW